MPNVLVAGQSGSGKSSIVNLIAGQKLAEISPDLSYCTKRCTEYPILVDEKEFHVFDTFGFLEPDLDRNLYATAIADTYSMIRAKGGLDLVLYCVNDDRIDDPKTQNNYRLLHEVLCDEEVPIGIVVTYRGRLKFEPDRYKSIFVARNIACVSCITANVDSMGSETQDATAVRKLLSTYCGTPESRSKLRQLWRTAIVTAKDLVGRGQSLKKGRLSTLLTRQCNLDEETADLVIKALEPHLSLKNRFYRTTYARGKCWLLVSCSFTFTNSDCSRDSRVNVLENRCPNGTAGGGRYQVSKSRS